MPYTIKFRRDTSTQWTSVNPILADGEMGIEKDTLKTKIGDGVTVWSLLDYSGGGVGEQGPQGIQGEPGIPGSPGSQGEKGDTGDTGQQGIQGVPGTQGEQGEQGEAGAPGTPGAKGDTGEQGQQGYQGNQGIQGIQGIQGETGAAGTSNYTLNVQALTSSPVDAQTIYFGNLPKAPTTTANISKVYIPKTGTIKRADIYCYSGTAGTNESWSIYIRLNNTTDTLIQTKAVNTNERVFSNASLSISVVAGDYIEIKSVNPTWVTNPLTVIFSGILYLE